jgi:hypothetical protein
MLSIKTRITCDLLRDGVFHSTREFRASIVRVGSVASSDWVLEGAAPREFFLLHDTRGTDWEIVPVSSDVMLNGTPLTSTSQPLTAAGRITLGAWEIRFSIARDEQQEAEDLIDGVGERAHLLARWAADARQVAGEEPHHQALAEALINEIKRFAPDDKAYDKALKHWGSWSLSRKRQLLRSYVKLVRELRANAERGSHMILASSSALGSDGFLNIYRMFPQGALQRARDTIIAMGELRAALDLIGTLKLRSMIEGAAETVGGNAQAQANASMQGLKMLVEKLESEFASAVVLLVTLLGRAGGYELTAEERELLKADAERSLS